MAPYIEIYLFSAIISVVAIFLALGIFRKVFQENYRKPWLYIGLAAVVLGSSQLVQFLAGYFSIYVINAYGSEVFSYVLDFLGMLCLTYGLLSEYLILKYYKGKFVKLNLVPVQEGSFGGKLDINVSRGKMYFAYMKDVRFFFSQFYEAVTSGFEGLMITEKSPLEMRQNYGVNKSPILWLNSINENLDSNYLSSQVDENSEVIDPIQLNKIISTIDSFLEASQHPFLVMELNLILKSNNFEVVHQLLTYISSRISTYEGVLILLLNSEQLDNDQFQRLKFIAEELE